MMIKIAKNLLLVSFIILLFTYSSYAEDARYFPPDEDGLQSVRIGVLARRGAEKCIESWGPTAEYLNNQISGVRFVIIPLDFDEITPKVKSQEVDFIVVNSSIYVELEALFGVTRIATMKDRSPSSASALFGGVIICRADRSDINSIEDLNGKSFVGVDETSFGGWRAAFRELKEAGIDPSEDFVKLSFAGTHDAVVFAVRDGLADAGTIATPILEEMISEGKIRPDSIKVINSLQHDRFPFVHSTRLYPKWPFAMLAHTPYAISKKVAIALLNMPADSPAVQAAGIEGWTVPLDYGPVNDCLKELRIGIYSDMGKIDFATSLRYYRWQIITALCVMTGLGLLLLTSIRLNNCLRESRSALEEESLERKQAEEALERASHLQELILMSAGEGILGLDLDGKVTFINPAATRMIGWELAEMMGAPYHEKVHHTMQGGAHFPEEKCTVHDSLRSGKACHVTDELFWRKDGTSFPVEYASTPIMEQDRIIGVVITFRDVTEQKRVQKAIQESEKKYRELFETMNQGVFNVRADGALTDVNPAALEMLGLTREEFLGRTVHSPEWKLLREDGTELPLNERPYVAALRTGRPVRNAVVGVFNPQTESYAWMIINAVPRYKPEDTVPYSVFATLHDITELKLATDEKEKLKSQVIQAQKMESVGRLAGGVAHDFNNMLSVILGYTDLALNRADLAEPFRRQLCQIRNAAERSAGLTRQLLAFARKQTARPKVLNLNEVVSETLDMLRRLIGEDINLVWTPGSDPWKVKIDPSQVDQILANLAVNARDAISGVGALTIRTDNIVIENSYCSTRAGFLPGEYVLISVSDTGEGMSKEVLDHIFEPFFTTKEAGKGTGLGLATVYGIVKQNNGFINAYSEFGIGTTFKIYLPRFGAEYKNALIEKLAEKTQGGTETILLVEDEKMLLELNKTLLAEMGYRVLSAQSPDEAINLAKNHAGDIHLLLTDVVMPGMNGRELSGRMRTVRPDLRTLFMSGYTADVIALNGVLDEGVNFIQKPFSLDELASKVRAELDPQESSVLVRNSA